MGKITKMYEKDIYLLWQQQKFKGDLFTAKGDTVIVLDKGELDPDKPGPDFQNARIKIGNLTYIGDVEIENNPANWKQHGHSIDSKYNKVILLVCMHNPGDYSYVHTKEGRKVQILSLAEYIPKQQFQTIESEYEAETSGENKMMRCYGNTDDVTFEIKSEILKSLGVERFRKKSERMFQRLKELAYIKELKLHEPKISYDLSAEFREKEDNNLDYQNKSLWQQLFYENIFEALGYSQNKSIMLKLAQSVNITFLEKITAGQNSEKQIESALFHIAGLLDNNNMNAEAEAYYNELNKEWVNIRRIYDGDYYSKSDWHFFRLRPQNFPTIRLAGGVKLASDILYGNFIGKLLRKINEIKNITVLIKVLRSVFIVKSEGYWGKHYIFNEVNRSEIKYFIGLSRADEIIVNVILPILLLYFEIFPNHTLSKKIISVYGTYEQNAENKIITDVSDALGLDHLYKKTVYAQGMIELFRTLCTKGKCEECGIGKIIYSDKS